jgi:hypothetical protein
MPDWLAAGTGRRVALLAACVGVGVVVYFAACSALGFRVRDLRLRAGP